MIKSVRIDLISDIVCPWCIIGYKNLESALLTLSDSLKAEIYWHPFELNPMMKREGQNLREYIAEKYGTTLEASIAARQTITELGHDLGFKFNFTDDMKIYNTRKAHQLLLWAQSKNLQLELEMALFQAYFTHNQDISNPQTLLSIADSLELERKLCEQILEDESWAEAVSSTEHQWIEAGINAVPAMIIEKKHLLSGAQPCEILVDALIDIADL